MARPGAGILDAMVVYALFCLAAATQFLLWGLVFYPALSSGQPFVPHHRPVSVVVCFRNEAANLESCLRAILEQSHPTFEVVAVDDNSTDDSATIARTIAAEDDRLRVLPAGYTRPGKKDALTFGIGAARYESILLTDADCLPASQTWLTTMTSPLTGHQDLVLGCSPYAHASGNLNRWQRFEATYVALQYVGFARVGLPYMGVGRNLAYRKSFFQRAGGMAAHAHLPGGDDDLLVGSTARAATTARVVEAEAWTYSSPTSDWRTYLGQKMRHQSVGAAYPGKIQWLLSGVALSHGLFYLLGFVLLFTPFFWSAVTLWLLRGLLVAAAYLRTPAREFLGGSAGAMTVLIGDALFAPFYLILAVGTLRRPKSW